MPIEAEALVHRALNWTERLRAQVPLDLSDQAAVLDYLESDAVLHDEVARFLEAFVAEEVAALPEQRVVDEPVAVKALEWKQIDDDDWWGASALGLSWEVRQARASVRVRTPDARQFEVFDGTVDQAKTLFQADYDRRIRSALALPPASPQAGMEAQIMHLALQLELIAQAVRAGRWESIIPDRAADFLQQAAEKLHPMFAAQPAPDAAAAAELWDCQECGGTGNETAGACRNCDGTGVDPDQPAPTVEGEAQGEGQRRADDWCDDYRTTPAFTPPAKNGEA